MSQNPKTKNKFKEAFMEKLEPTRYIRIFYSDNNDNSYVIADYGNEPIIDLKGHTYSLDKTALTHEGKPMYFVRQGFNCSIPIIWNENNKCLMEKGLSSADMCMYRRSHAVQVMYGLKPKFSFVNLLSYLLVIIVSVLITYISVSSYFQSLL